VWESVAVDVAESDEDGVCVRVRIVVPVWDPVAVGVGTRLDESVTVFDFVCDLVRVGDADAVTVGGAVFVTDAVSEADLESELL
jgi:hypothetical protein